MLQVHPDGFVQRVWRPLDVLQNFGQRVVIQCRQRASGAEARVHPHRKGELVTRVLKAGPQGKRPRTREGSGSLSHRGRAAATPAARQGRRCQVTTGKKLADD